MPANVNIYKLTDGGQVVEVRGREKLRVELRNALMKRKCRVRVAWYHNTGNSKWDWMPTKHSVLRFTKWTYSPIGASHARLLMEIKQPIPPLDLDTLAGQLFLLM